MPVYLLGSGFSRAISDHMPVMDGLSKAVLADLESQGLSQIPGLNTPLEKNFERWLSYLIEAPPWLTDGDVSRGQGAFNDIVSSLHKVLSIQQLYVVDSAPPEWLLKLVRYWEHVGATVISFNYDLLVEMAWLEAHENRYWGEFYPVALTPIAHRVAGVLGSGGSVANLRLLKLHGSLNWRYSGPHSPAGDPVYDVGFGRWGDMGAVSVYEDVDKLSADKRAMIIPPAAVKSPYYMNNTVRAMWRLAAEALRQTDELVVMGFSLPTSDQIVSSMLATELNGQADVIPVDYSDAIVDRLEDVLDARGRKRIIGEYAGGGEGAIEKWVRTRANF